MRWGRRLRPGARAQRAADERIEPTRDGGPRDEGARAAESDSPPTARPTAKPTASPTPTPSPLGAIKHVVVIVQENRSVDNLFQGYPGANTVSSGQISTGQTVQLVPIPIHVGFDVSHGLPDFLAACDGGPQGMTV